MSICVHISGAGKGSTGASDPQVTMLKEALLLSFKCSMSLVFGVSFCREDDGLKNSSTFSDSSQFAPLSVLVV